MNLKSLRIALGFVLLLSGCLVTSRNRERIEGKYVAENTFSQIESGKTTAGWVKATLGQPSEVTKDETAGTEIWRYNYTEIKEGSGAIFLIFGGSSHKERPGAAYIEFKDGIVKKKWRN